LRHFFLIDFFILSLIVLQYVLVKSYRLSFQLRYKKKIHNDKILGVVWIVTLDVPSYVKSTLDWTFFFGKFFCVFERLKCRFQFFKSLLPSFSNRYEYNAIILDLPRKKLPMWLPKKSTIMCFYPKLHLLSYNIKGLNEEEEVRKLSQYILGIFPRVDVMFLQEHKLKGQKA
jgi:hypothetical protein